MSFCPVPHSRREQAWLLIGAGLGAGVAFLSHRRRKSQATEASSPAAEDGRASGAAAAAAAPQEAPSASDPPLDHVVLTSDPLPLGSLASKVVCPSAGGIASFIGTTRDHFEGKEVVRLEYEAYAPMADKEIRKIIATIRGRWTVRHVAVAHRIGVVPSAQASVEIAISSTHRAEALMAVQFAIDELKRTVPIWKKEVYREGAAQWKENKEWVPPANYGPQAPTGPPSEIVALAPPNTLEDVLEELQRS